MPRWTIPLTLAVALFAPALALAYTPEVLGVSAIPDENPNELLRIYGPFAE